METGITVGMDVEETAADVAAAIVGTITAETVGKIILVPEHLTKVSRVGSTRDSRAEEMTTEMMWTIADAEIVEETGKIVAENKKKGLNSWEYRGLAPFSFCIYMEKAW